VNYFATIESAQEYLTKLEETLVETRAQIAKEMEATDKRTRRMEGLAIARYQLELGERRLKKLQQVLTNLRRLEKILCR